MNPTDNQQYSIVRRRNLLNSLREKMSFRSTASVSAINYNMPSKSIIKKNASTPAKTKTVRFAQSEPAIEYVSRLPKALFYSQPELQKIEKKWRKKVSEAKIRGHSRYLEGQPVTQHRLMRWAIRADETRGLETEVNPSFSLRREKAIETHLMRVMVAQRVHRIQGSKTSEDVLRQFSESSSQTSVKIARMMGHADYNAVMAMCHQPSVAAAGA